MKRNITTLVIAFSVFLVGLTAESKNVTIVSHGDDGAIYSSSLLKTVDLISGTGGGGPVDWNGIVFFELPAQPFDTASLRLTVQVFTGAMTSGNIDVWGLGYQATPAMNKSWLLTANTDGRTLLNGSTPTKIADNIVTQGQIVAVGDVWQPDAAQRSTLKTFLNGLYDKGATPGDYAVIRINQDAVLAPANEGVRWGGSHRTSPDYRAKLSGSISGLINPGFEYGSGDNAYNWTQTATSGVLIQRSAVFARTGSFGMRFNAAVATGGANASQINQEVTGLVPGKYLKMSGYLRQQSGFPLEGGQYVQFRLWWYNGGTGVGADTVTVLSVGDPVDTWINRIIIGVVPDGADRVKADVIFRHDGNNTSDGVVHIDDISLVVLPTSSAIKFR